MQNRPCLLLFFSETDCSSDLLIIISDLCRSATTATPRFKNLHKSEANNPELLTHNKPRIQNRRIPQKFRMIEHFELTKEYF